MRLPLVSDPSGTGSRHHHTGLVSATIDRNRARAERRTSTRGKSAVGTVGGPPQATDARAVDADACGTPGPGDDAELGIRSADHVGFHRD